MPQISNEIIEGLKNFNTPTVFNAMVKKLGRPNEEYTGHEIRCLVNSPQPVIGFAVTVEVTTNDPDPPSISWVPYYRYMEENPGPHFAVMKDVDSRPGRGASFGDNMAVMHSRFGAVGVIVDGTVRDLDGIKETGFPTWAWGVTPGHGLFCITHVNTSITIGQLRIRPNDLLMADINGCIRIPKDCAKDILQLSGEIVEEESKMRLYSRSKDCTVEGLNKRFKWDERALSN